MCMSMRCCAYFMPVRCAKCAQCRLLKAVSMSVVHSCVCTDATIQGSSARRCLASIKSVSDAPTGPRSLGIGCYRFGYCCPRYPVVEVGSPFAVCSPCGSSKAVSQSSVGHRLHVSKSHHSRCWLHVAHILLLSIVTTTT